MTCSSKLRAWLAQVVSGMLPFALAACVAAGPTDNMPATSPPQPPGESAELDSIRAQRGRSLEFTVYTYGPGDEVFERFGHIALAMHDLENGENIAFNWGMFDFEQPGFLRRFLTGDTKYWMAGYRTEQFNAVYRDTNRSIRAQTLALTPVQKGALYDYLVWNAAETNKYYRYDYYRDNCSTRVRDILDWALSGELSAVSRDVLGNVTWRGETARITADDIPVYAGIEIALGRHADEPLDVWSEAFLPEHLADQLSAMKSAGGPLVSRDEMLFHANRAPMPAVAPPTFNTALVTGLLAGMAILLLSSLASSSSNSSVGIFSTAGISIIGGLWYLAGGVIGTALLLAATMTKHAPYMGANISAFVFSPLLLVAAFLWPWRGSTRRYGRAARMVAALCAAFSILAVALIMVPSFTQKSYMVLAVAVPVNCALAWAAFRSNGRREPAVTAGTDSQ